MNLIILSKIPSFVLALIIIEVVIMVGLGGFLIFDIVKGKLKERKKKIIQDFIKPLLDVQILSQIDRCTLKRYYKRFRRSSI